MGNTSFCHKSCFFSGLDVEVEDTIKEAVADVAKKFPDEKKTESELLQQLMRFKEATTAGESGKEVKDVR